MMFLNHKIKTFKSTLDEIDSLDKQVNEFLKTVDSAELTIKVSSIKDNNINYIVYTLLYKD